MRGVMEKGREMNVIIGGNFNFKIREKRGSMEGGKSKKKSKDKTIGNNRRKLINYS